MASGPLVGGGGGGDGSSERHRWSESKVYTRKSHGKAPRPSANSSQQPPISSSQTPGTTADDVSSTHRNQPPPPPLPALQQPLPPSSSAVAAEDEASSLNRVQRDRASGSGGLPNGHGRSVVISIGSRYSRQERWELRRKLSAELEQVRALSTKLEARELQLSTATVTSAAPEAGYTQSQFSATDPKTPVAIKRVLEVAPVVVSTPSVPKNRQLSISVAAMKNAPTESVDKEKRTPKANQYYRNSDFLLGKDKFPPLDPHSHKKSKANGSKRHSSVGEAEHHSIERKLYAQAFKRCASLLSKLMKHKFGWVFNSPVDAKALGLHDYFTIIKHPMDLGTVNSRLSRNWYKSPREFAEDVRLTFHNAMTYNPKEQDVHVIAEQLSQIFEEHWPAIEAEIAYNTYLSDPKVAPPVDVRTLERSDSTVHPVAVDPKPKLVNNVPHIGRPLPLKKPKAKDLDKRDMTFEEKQKLSNNLQNLPPKKLDIIVQIIKNKNLSLSQHDDEIEVDIDSMDTETLWELDRFVTNYKKNLSKNKRKAELAMLARRDAEEHAPQDVQERVPESMVVEAPNASKTDAAADDKHVASSVPAQLEKTENANKLSSTSSSSSDSGSSSSDSDSDSSSGYGSDAANSQ